MIQKLHINILTFSLLLCSFNVNAANFFVDRLKVQFAGEIGLASVGAGVDISKTHTFDLFYGIVPHSIGGDFIETYSIKNEHHYPYFDFSKNLNFAPYFGLNIFHVIGLKYQTSRLNNYPRNYYRTSSIRLLPYLGVEYKYDMKKSENYYFEMGINDIWLINLYNNHEVLDYKDYISLALGYTYTI